MNDGSGHAVAARAKPTLRRFSLVLITSVLGMAGLGISTAAASTTTTPDTITIGVPPANIRQNRESDIPLKATSSDPDATITSWAVTGLPPGLTLDPATGVITGIDSQPLDRPSERVVVTVTVTDSTGATATAPVTLFVDPEYVSVDNPGNQTTTNGGSVDVPIVANGGFGNLTYTADVLPSGLHINATTGVITGHATRSVDTTVTVTVTDVVGNPAWTTFHWTVDDVSAVTRGASTSVVYGKSTRLAAKLTDSSTRKVLSGDTLTLQCRATTVSTFKTCGAAKTNASGLAYFTVRPGVSTYYRWYYPASDVTKSAYSTTGSVSVAQAVSVARSATRVRHGGYETLYGSVAPNADGAYVYVELYSGSRWKITTIRAKVAAQTLLNHRHYASGYKLRFKLASKTTYRLRVYCPATSHNSAGYSATKEVVSF